MVSYIRGFTKMHVEYMTNLLTEAFKKAQELPDHLQNELAEQLIEDIENEIKWQQLLSEPQNMKLEELAAKALSDSMNGKTREMGFDEL
jgi:ribonucleotide reductase beta subunit family protein with ferritin-like domain